MRKIVDFMKGIIDGITSKQIVFGLGVLLIALFMVLMSVMLFDSAAESIGNLLGIQDNKIKTIQFIGWAIGGVFFATVLAFLSQWAESQVEHNSSVEKGHTQERFKTATEHLGHEDAHYRQMKFRLNAWHVFCILKNSISDKEVVSDMIILYGQARRKN